MKIGVLDIQGSVEEHFEALQKLKTVGKGVKVMPVLVKKVEDLKGLAGLILPGGESTVISKLIDRFSLREPIKERVKNGMCIWGTCAGAILLAKEIGGDEKVNPLKLLDISIKRNAYGRQMDSFETEIQFDFGSGVVKKIPAVFIRAPKILRVGRGVKVLAKIGTNPIAVIADLGQRAVGMATTFHPEMTESALVHRYFAEACLKDLS